MPPMAMPELSTSVHSSHRSTIQLVNSVLNLEFQPKYVIHPPGGIIVQHHFLDFLQLNSNSNGDKFGRVCVFSDG